MRTLGWIAGTGDFKIALTNQQVQEILKTGTGDFKIALTNQQVQGNYVSPMRLQIYITS
jgi:hypothetical protein